MLIVLLAVHAVSYAAAQGGSVAVGLNYPGLSLRYCLTDKYAAELRGQFDDNGSVVGARVNRFFGARKEQKLCYLLGVEGDIVNYKGVVSTGKGFAGEVYFGGEYYFVKNMSFLMDFGPAMIVLEDNSTQTSVNGIEFVVNIGINYYFRLR